MSQSLRP
ncbi:MAG: hypothetical protein YYHSYBAR_001454 [Candidatus Fervidibacter sacchari]